MWKLLGKILVSLLFVLMTTMFMIIFHLCLGLSVTQAIITVGIVFGIDLLIVGMGWVFTRIFDKED